MSEPATVTRPRPARRQLWLLALLVIALYIVLPQLGSFDQSLERLKQADLSLTGLAVVAILLTYLAATATYCLLAFKPLNYLRTLLVQFASMFINRLLPAGIGALGASYAYLRHSGHSTAQATTIVAANNILGFIGHNCVLVVSLLLLQTPLPTWHLSFKLTPLMWAGLLAVICLAAVVLLSQRRLAHRLGETLKDIGRQTASYRQRPWAVVTALLTSICLTLGNVFCLWFCLLAVGAHLPFVAILLVFTFGLALGTATPTPGGLGGIEAGLVAGLVAYHISSSEALAAVLLYRLISYWLMLALGSVAFVFCQQRHYFDIHRVETN